MKAFEVESSLKRSAPSPIYLLVGEEDFLRDQALKVIKSAVLGAEGLEGFNDDVFYGDECVATDILGCANELPVFAERRLVVVKGTEKLSAREGEAIIPYCQEPNGSTTLVFTAAKLDNRLKFPQALKKHAMTVDCGALPPAQVPRWIEAQAKELGVRLDADAVHLLAELSSQSLYLLKRELEKLASSVPSGTVVGPAEVELLRGTQPEASVFDLSAAIGAGDSGRALRILARNLEAGEQPLRMLGALIWQYRRLWKARTLLDGGSPEGELARAIGIPPFRVKEFVGQVRLFTHAQLRKAFQLFLETDSALKGGRAIPPKGILADLVLQLCRETTQTKQKPVQEGAIKKTDQSAVQPTPRKKKTRTIQNVRVIRSGRKLSS